MMSDDHPIDYYCDVNENLWTIFHLTDGSFYAYSFCGLSEVVEIEGAEYFEEVIQRIKEKAQ
jgi:hypothetical protein